MADDSGRWDASSPISPALAAALEAAQVASEEDDLALQQLTQAVEALEKGQSE